MVCQERLWRLSPGPTELPLRCDLSETEKSGNRKENAMVGQSFKKVATSSQQGRRSVADENQSPPVF